jgi:AcrR family transcriptional regulator
MSELPNQEKPMRSDARRNRGRILDAARELFASERPEVGIDEVARLAEVGVGTVYRHFPDKEALMGALVRERFATFNERLTTAVANEQVEPFSLLVETMRANAASMAQDAATRFALMSHGERVFAHAQAEGEEFLRLTGVLVERAQRAGRLRNDFTAEDVPMIMCGVCATMDARKPDWSWEHHLDLLISGMRAEP